MLPLIEIRRGIAFGHDAPTEPSAVVALTVPSGKFVDLRVPREAASVAAATAVMPTAFALSPGVYATAGLLTTAVPVADGPFACPDTEAVLAHYTWLHQIDSSGAVDVADGADMLLLADGAVLEVGLFNRHDGQGPQLFKEFWAHEDAAGQPWLVAETAGEAAGRGMIVRIGPHCQGVLQTAGCFWLERWRAGHGSWTRDPCSTHAQRTGSDGPVAEVAGVDVDDAVAAPCRWLCEDGRAVHDVLQVAGREWRVTEAGEGRV